MKKTLLFFLISTGLFAQTGIGTTTPHSSAKLEVSASDKGFLPPRVTLTSATDITTIASPAEGLMVYNVGSVGLQAGYYYWNGSIWIESTFKRWSRRSQRDSRCVLRCIPEREAIHGRHN